MCDNHAVWLLFFAVGTIRSFAQLIAIVNGSKLVNRAEAASLALNYAPVAPTIASIEEARTT